MTTTPVPTTSQADLHRGARVTQRRVMRSEWTKFRSLRSTRYALIAAIVLFIVAGMLIPWINARQTMSAAQRASFDPVDAALSPALLVQFVTGVLGVLLMSGEYATGMNRATFAAVPRRLPVLWAKASVFAVISMLTMTAAVFIAFVGGQAMLSSAHLNVSLSHPGVVRAVIGAAFFLTMVGLLGIALGALVRSTAGAITLLILILQGLHLIAAFLPTRWDDDVSRFLLFNVANSLIGVVPQPGSIMLSTGAAIAVLAAYVAPFLGVAAVLLVRRDA